MNATSKELSLELFAEEMPFDGNLEAEELSNVRAATGCLSTVSTLSSAGCYMCLSTGGCISG